MSGIMNDLKGKKFGRLTVLYDSNKRSSEGQVIWTCVCICGCFVEVKAGNLKTHHTESCGCLKRERPPAYKHGEARNNLQTRLHRIWSGIRGRCNSPNQTSYKYYGARGIKICDEWNNDFIVFRSWALANGYQENLTIDRIDNDGNYCPKNCQWITQGENAKKGNLIRWKNKHYKEKA